MKGLFGCCLAFVIVLVVIIGLLIGGTYYVLNMTFDELGLSDQELVNGKTVAELGLSDVKIIDVYKFITSIMEGVPDESTIVTHPFSESDLTTLKGKLGDSNIIDETGEFVFDDVDGGFVLFPDATPITFLDKELAALFNEMIDLGMDEANSDEQQQVADEEGGDVTPPELSIREVKITVNAGGDGATIRTVLKIDITEIKGQMIETVPSQLQNYIQLGDAIYIITESEISANNEGRLQAGDNHTITINNIPQAISNPFLNFLGNAIAEGNEEEIVGIDGQPIEPDEGFFAEMVCGVFSEFIYRFGLLGANSSSLGNSGFSTVGDSGAITIVPWTADTAPAEESYQDEIF